MPQARFLSLCVFVLALAPFTGRAALPPVRVAVFDDAAYVDTSSGGISAESDNVQAALVSLGVTVTTFTGITDVAWRNGTSTANVVLVPDLEVGDLAAALNENAEQVILDFVAAGGVLIVQGDAASRQTGLINAVFGFGTVSVAGAVANLTELVAGTRFVQGPASLPNNNATVGIGGFPAGTTVAYTSPLHVSTVISIPYGAGKVICMGWDWYDAVPIGAADGGWNEVLRRAVLEGRPPTRRIALLDDPLYVDSTGGSLAESDTLQAALVSRDMLVAPFVGITAVFFETALGPPRRPRADVLAIPEQSNLDVGPALDVLAVRRIQEFVSTGGTLLVAGGTDADAAATLLNTVFGFATSAGFIVDGTSSALADTAGTLFAGAAVSLPSPSNTSTLTGLPAGSQSIYTNTGGASVALIPYGEGRILYLGWDFFSAVPIGAVDDGWLDVLDRATRTAPPARRVAVFADPAYVDAAEEIPEPPNAAAETVNMRASLVERGHVPLPFIGTTQTAWSAALAGADVLVVPDQEVADLTAALDAATRADIAAFVRRGGLLITPIGAGARGLVLVNALFATSMNVVNLPGPYPANDERFGTPLEIGLGALPQNNATLNAAGVPEEARVIYGTLTQSTLSWLQFGAGHVLVLGWDWFDATSAGGTLDGGWIDVLDLAVQSARSRARRVAVFDNPTYVDTGGLPGSESDNVQAALTSLDHPVRPFTGISAASLREATASADVVLVPDLEVADLAPALAADAAKELRDFVAAGGALVVHGSGGSRTANLLNSVFGWSVSQPAGGPVLPISLVPTGVLGTRFGGSPGSVGNNNGTLLVAGLPFGGRPIYTDAGATSVVAWLPYGLGRVVYLGWDFFNAAPVGPQDAGWLNVLDRAVQEARPRTRRVATHHLPAFNDTALGEESDNLRRALEAVGEVPSFNFLYPQTQAAAIPELEVAQTTINYQELRNYVARGNVLVLCLDGFGRATDLLGLAFGFQGVGTAAAGQPVFARTPLAGGTSFAGGPAELRNLPATRIVTNLPSGALRMYEGGAANVVVAALPYGAGQIVLLGWDFSGLRPYLSVDLGQAAWFEVLRRALDAAPPGARRVAVVDDPLYVDTAGGPGAESDTVQASLLALEHAVVPFVGVGQADFANALSRADTLLVPEQDAGDLTAALTPPARGEITSFVNGGGALVVHGTANGFRSSLLLNALFGYTLTENVAADPSYVFTGNAAVLGTQFELFTPNVLASNSAVIGLTNGTSPPSAQVAYGGTTTLKAAVVVFERNHGRSVYLGWDWFNAAPLGSSDGGWIDVLDRAVREGMGGDADGDGVGTSVDLCPWLANPSQADADADGVGDVCDNCSAFANPRVPLGTEDFTFNNAWATLTGAQRDDDHDGYGNKCDAKFPGVAGNSVGGLDLNQFRASNGKPRAGDTCGTLGTRPCAIFDLDELANSIGGLDLNRFRQLNGLPPGPKCALCPLPCTAGGDGTCN